MTPSPISPLVNPVNARARGTLLVTRLQIASVLAAVLAMLVALLVLTGWALDIRLLKSVLPRLVAMNPLTAVAFALAGGSLWLRRDPDAGRATRATALVLAALVAGIGAVKLASYFPAVPVRIDTLLFRHALEAEAVPNRMAPNSAANFLITGLALMFLDVQTARGRRPAQALAIALALSSLLALIGYAYRMTSLYAVRSLIPMAVHTAFTFMVLALGILFARPDRGLMRTITGDSPAGFLGRRLLPAAALVPALLGLLRLLGQRAELFTPDLGGDLVVIANVLVLSGLVWWNLSLLQKSDTARKATESALRESEQRFRAVVEQTAEGIYLVDADTKRVLETNRAFRALLGYTKSEIENRLVFDFIEDEPAAIEARLQKAFSGATYVFGERRYRRKDSSLVDVEVSATVINIGGRRVLCAVARDITQRKLTERQLQEKNRQLEETARAERQAREALIKAQGQMLQTEKLAALGQMVAGVAHEINNPLSFVANNVAVLQRDLRAVVEVLRLYEQARAELAAKLPELSAAVGQLSQRTDLPYTLGNIQELLSRSREGLKRIQQIVKDLRDFARLDESEVQEADLNAGVQSTVNIIVGHARKKRVKIETQLGPLPPVHCYPAKVNQVVMNLISNAIDASHEGGTVTVRTHAEDGAARIEVQDEGTGIDSAAVGRIFDPFFTTKPQGQGTGLGLSISYGIVQDHGGTIEVESTPGKGSCFTVSLPIGKKEGSG